MLSSDVEVMASRVLLATADPVLRETRVALIKSFGFHTTASTSLEHALRLIADMPFDILVIGHTLTAEACDTISREFRKHKSQGRIIEILRSFGDDSKCHPDVTVVGLEGPLRLRDVLLEQERIACQRNRDS